MATINSKFNGVLRKNPINPRYFTDAKGKAIYLTGSHNWMSVQDFWLADKPRKYFDFTAFLDMMEEKGHNFYRFWPYSLHSSGSPWTKEKVLYDPLPYKRTGKGTALDGQPKFDLDQWNDEYFNRLRERLEEANRRGFYVSVMFFEAWSIHWATEELNPWPFHPYNIENNVNGVDGDPDKDGMGDCYSLEVPLVVEYQKSFIRKVIDITNDLDNIIYEIANELPEDDRATLWHHHMLDYVKEYEKTKPKQHPVGMTAQGFLQTYDLLEGNNADWISPGTGTHWEYRYNPPASDGKKVIIADTDHIWSHGGSPRWVWMCLTRGLNPIFMDPWEPVPGHTIDGYASDDLNRKDNPQWEPIRDNLGYARKYALRMDLNYALPHGELSTSNFCLANPGNEYLILVLGGPVGVDLRAYEKEFSVEWFNPKDGTSVIGEPVRGGNVLGCEFVPPFEGDAVLYLKAK